MSTQIRDSAFEPYSLLRDFEQALGARRTQIGATASFVGSMRDFNDNNHVSSMRLEHYPGMTEKHLERIATQAKARWSLDEVLIVHRVGEVRPGDAIVLVASWSAHRAHAFESCQHMMEDLKSNAPFWKKEQTADGERWVSNNTPGRSADFAQK